MASNRFHSYASASISTLLIDFLVETNLKLVVNFCKHSQSAPGGHTTHFQPFISRIFVAGFTGFLFTFLLQGLKIYFLSHKNLFTQKGTYSRHFTHFISYQGLKYYTMKAGQISPPPLSLLLGVKGTNGSLRIFYFILFCCQRIKNRRDLCQLMQ